MSSAELCKTVMALPELDRLALARQIVESLTEGKPAGPSVEEGVRRIEEVASGKMPGWTEDQFRDATQ